MRGRPLRIKIRRNLRKACANHAICQEIALLLQFGVPLSIVQLVALVLNMQDTSEYDVPLGCLQFVEYFAGSCTVTRHLQAQGYQGVPYDKLFNNVLQNVLCYKGFCFAMWLACMVDSAGIVFLAPVCSSWVWVCRSGSGRCAAFPLGDTSKRFVRHGNAMVSRTVLLLWILEARGVFWVLEQPLSSLLYLHCRFQQFLRIRPVYRINFFMQSFAGNDDMHDVSPKPTVLYSNRSALMKIATRAQELQSCSTARSSHTLCYEAKNGGVTGNKEALEASSAYPSLFGKTIADIFSAHQDELRAFSEQARRHHGPRGVKDARLLHVLKRSEDAWRDAGLEPVWDWLLDNQCCM